MMRVGLFLGVEASAGGMYQYAQSLLEGLRLLPTDRFQVTVAFTGQVWANMLEQYPFPKVCVRGARVGQQLASLCMLARLPAPMARSINSFINPIAWHLTRSNVCDLWIFPAQDPVAYQLKVPAVVAVHDLMHRYEPGFPEVTEWGRYHIREHRFRNLVKSAKAILVDSEIGKSHVVECYKIDSGRIFPLPYIPPGYILEVISGSSRRTHFSIPDKYFFYPAQFWPHKNHLSLVKAAASIIDRCPDLHIVFTGSERFAFGEIRKLVSSLNLRANVSFLGRVPDQDLVSLYRGARALVMPTFFGPTNIPPLEALACDCPVAVSDIYGMREQLGDAALYFDPYSIEDIANALLRLWTDDDLCCRLRQFGQAQSMKWGQREFGARLLEILEQIEQDHFGN